MSTPLYRRMKQKGTSFFSFPLTSMNPNPNFSKFVLLHLPPKKDGEIFDFELLTSDNNSGNPFDIYTSNVNPSGSYADYFIESLRNYVANHDTTMRESRMNATNDFYNIKEPQTPTEKIFWKWLRKIGGLKFEPAEHKIDWDKNLDDFDNPNADTITNTDYFRKYLWKEREVRDYSFSTYIYEGSYMSLGNNIVKIIIDFVAKFKVGDKVLIKGDIIGELSVGTSYDVLQVEVDDVLNETYIYISDDNVTTGGVNLNAIVYLDYQRVVQYIGEINVKSEVSTATKDETEVMAYIPHQAGRTPSILWEVSNDTNYYPGLELPLIADQIQTEIRGAENLDSPIRQNPSDYPGLYYGQYDDPNKTYKASSGDKKRYSGDYYGIKRNNNVGLSEEDYIERLGEFDASKIDGLTLDFNLNHYLKMSITDEQVGFNFDEFNQMSIDGNPPEDFQYNAVLWFYEKELEDGSVVSSLYGVTFLNNPDNDDDTDGTYISPYDKLVSTDEHDGLSYQHVLNLSTSVDNDQSSMSFDPLTINNTFGFDLYNNLMSNVGKLNESFINIIDEFTRINEELNNVKSIVYTQTDIDLIKSKLKNMEELLKVYSTYQFVETDTVKIISDFSGVYPTLGFDVKGVEYESVITMTSDVLYSNKTNTGEDYKIQVPDTNKLFLKITNVDITDYGDLGIVLSNDLDYKQSIEILIDAKDAFYGNKLNIYMNYDNGSVLGQQKTLLVDNVYLPTDIINYIPDNITYGKVKYMTTSTYQNVNLIDSVSGSTLNQYTLLYTDAQNIFGNTQYPEQVFIHDFIFIEGGEVVNYSGMYSVNSIDYNQAYIKIDFDSTGMTPVGIPRIYAYKGMKIEILRDSESPTSTIKDRYLIQKTFI